VVPAKEKDVLSWKVWRYLRRPGAGPVHPAPVHGHVRRRGQQVRRQLVPHGELGVAEEVDPGPEVGALELRPEELAAGGLGPGGQAGGEEAEGEVHGVEEDGGDAEAGVPGRGVGAEQVGVTHLQGQGHPACHNVHNTTVASKYLDHVLTFVHLASV
jgi:hypothetical protein